jgi:hypothetical protein
MKHLTATQNHLPSESRIDPAWIAVVAEKVKTMRFGVVQITVHDSKVVQIERTERTRFEVGQSANC